MDIDEIFVKSYLAEFTEKEKQKNITSKEEQAICEAKKRKLENIEKFLQKFVDLEIIVNHKDKHTNNVSSIYEIQPQKFEIRHAESSKKWAPGISILFDHPADVEIAIPNRPDEEGIVVIKVASEHPDSYILEQHFTSFESACEALGKFLGKCTVSIGKDHTQILKEYHQKRITVIKPEKQDIADTLSSIPLQPPKKSDLNQKDTLSLKRIGDFFKINRHKDEDEDLD
jgi:hypothetical protein